MIRFPNILAVLCVAAAFVVATTTVRAEEHPAPPSTTAAHGETAHSETAAETGHSAADAHHGEEPGGIASDLPFWGIVAFIGFLFAIKALGWDSLTSNMQTREENENRLIAEAERLRDEASGRLRTHQGYMEALDEHVRAALAEADRDANYTRGDIRAAADREARTTQSRAEAEVSRVKDQSLHDIFDTMASRVAEAAEQRIRSKLSAADQDQLVEAAVSDFAAHGKE